jgi:hypothetical protein
METVAMVARNVEAMSDRQMAGPLRRRAHKEKGLDNKLLGPAYLTGLSTIFKSYRCRNGSGRGEAVSDNQPGMTAKRHNTPHEERALELGADELIARHEWC